mgnify:CR=1 FL=1
MVNLNVKLYSCEENYILSSDFFGSIVYYCGTSWYLGDYPSGKDYD